MCRRPGLRARPDAGGASLIEALIALVVMSFGMLALVGVQATLRLNSDITRQRGEATRIAMQEMELVRSFISVPVVGGRPGVSWDEIASRSVDPVPMPAGASNTTYTLTRTVTAQGATQKSIHVVVTWKDRTADPDQSVLPNQSVTFDAILVSASPPLASLLRVPTRPSAVAQRSGRHPTIPPWAQDLGNGSSGFKPVESGGVVWVFDNVTGMITSLCTNTTAASTAALTTANLGTCTPTSALLLSGTVNFNLRGATAVLSSDSTQSVFKPVAGGTVAWIIDNASSSVTQTCTVSAGSTTATLAGGTDPLGACATVAPPQAVSPFNPPPSPPLDCGGAALCSKDSESPLWPALNLDLALLSGAANVSSFICYDDAPTSAAAANAQSTVKYYCAVVPMDAAGWGGQVNVVPAGFSEDANVTPWDIGTTASTYKVCRYTTASSDFATTNADHPKYYCHVASTTVASSPSLLCAYDPGNSIPLTGTPVTTNLVNQNFLVIAGDKSCPTDVAANPGAGDLVDSNTLEHQP